MKYKNLDTCFLGNYIDMIQLIAFIPKSVIQQNHNHIQSFRIKSNLI